MTKQGEEYELFVKDIYRILNSADGLSDVNIQHNIIVPGISRKHQIDIFWTFSFGGIRYKVAVECKDYKNPVEAEKIDAFRSVLQDIGGVHGIFVAKNGFQTGAIKVAQTYGIQLMEIRHPEEKDWEGYIKKIIFTIIIQSKENIRPQIIVDDAWMNNNGVNADDLKSFLAKNNEVFVVEYDNSEISPKEISKIRLLDLQEKLPVNEQGKDLSYKFEFNNAYLEYETMHLKIKQIIFTYDVLFYTRETCIDGDKIIKAIVKNIIDGTTQIVDKHENVKSRERRPAV